MSMESDLGASTAFSSSSSKRTNCPLANSYPFSMSSRGTSTSWVGHTYCCLTLVPQSLWTMLNEIFRADSPVEYSFTGRDTSPKAMVEVPMARADIVWQTYVHAHRRATKK